MKYIVLLLSSILFLSLINNILSYEYSLNIIDDPSSEKWNFDEIDKLFIDEYREVKKIGKVQMVYHFDQNKNHTETEIDFKLNNGLVLKLGNYLTLDENDQKILISMLQSNELKNKSESYETYNCIGKNWYSVHFIGESNGINKTITWVSNTTNKSIMCTSLQQIYLKYIKRFNDNYNK